MSWLAGGGCGELYKTPLSLFYSSAPEQQSPLAPNKTVRKEDRCVSGSALPKELDVSIDVCPSRKCHDNHAMIFPRPTPFLESSHRRGHGCVQLAWNGIQKKWIFEGSEIRNRRIEDTCDMLCVVLEFLRE
jgi:hypothetical protein